MTIHELANASRATFLDVPFNLHGLEQFPPADTDVLVSEDGELVIGINRRTARFAASRANIIATGSVNSTFPTQLVSQLLGKSPAV